MEVKEIISLIHYVLYNLDYHVLSGNISFELNSYLDYNQQATPGNHKSMYNANRQINHQRNNKRTENQHHLAKQLYMLKTKRKTNLAPSFPPQRTPPPANPGCIHHSKTRLTSPILKPNPINHLRKRRIRPRPISISSPRRRIHRPQRSRTIRQSTRWRINPNTLRTGLPRRNNLAGWRNW